MLVFPMDKLPSYYKPQDSSTVISAFYQKFNQDLAEVYPEDSLIQDHIVTEPVEVFWFNHYSQYLELSCEIEEASDYNEFVFETLTDSEYSKDFLSFIAEGRTFQDATTKTLAIYKEQLDFIYKYHLKKDISEISSNYRENADLGDFQNQVGGIKKEILGSKINLLDNQKTDIFLNRIEDAIKKIKDLAPLAFERLSTYSHNLVPIHISGFVSFSSDSLPGYSSINFYERDDVDLLDDLLHENGHHQLNYYLYLFDLFNEEDETLYYSPWREAMRPLRGLYHGYCTFFWAYDLFYHLLSHPKLSEHFSNNERMKIANRFIEEEILLESAHQELINAYDNQLITEQGMEIIKEIDHYINSYRQITAQIIKDYDLSSNYQKLKEKLLDTKRKMENHIETL